MGAVNGEGRWCTSGKAGSSEALAIATYISTISTDQQQRDLSKATVTLSRSDEVLGSA